MKYKVGVVHGRFQLFHNDHLKYVLAAKKECDHLIVGICNPDKRMTLFTDANPHRSSDSANPFTYFERYEMIKGALLENGLSLEEFDIVPFPINYPEYLPNYVPMDAKFFLTIYDAWGVEKKEKLTSIGCDVEVLWHVNLSEKGISGTDIRNNIINGDPWDNVVPQFVYNYILTHQLDKRLCKINRV